ncbi:hypothetical protein [Nocardia gamkensis]|uniref:hypothetical protein n=1 Tax=Nocardia gamkensis TaxID=352869 RepID=UPI0037C6D0C3
MSRSGEAIDACTAFVGAAVAGVTLFLPVAVRARPSATSYQVTGLLHNVPRGAALGVIVAVMVAVVITTTSRPLIGWSTAAVGSVAQLINHLAAPEVPSADLLTTQNYLDAVCAAVVLGALGAVVLHRSLPAAGFALGGIGFFAFGGQAQVLGTDPSLRAMSETPSRWLICAAAALLIISTLRNRSATVEVEPSPTEGEVPLKPIFAAIVLAVFVLAATEWLGRRFSNTPGDSHLFDVGVVVLVTIVGVTAAAILLPGRDGAAAYLAVSLSAAADAVGYGPRPGWAVVVLLGLAAVGTAVGDRLPSITVAIALIAGIAGVAVADFTFASVGGLGFAALSVAIALTAGYCCGTARPHEAPSGVLAIAALFLPTVVSVAPYKVRNWYGEDPTHSATPDTAALVIALSSAVGLFALYRFRSREAPPLHAQPDGD